MFARWVQVMVRFERALYADPERDLDRLWWDLVERYQRVKRPEGRRAPDWAAKIHLATAPVYYHAYLMGECTASQLHRHVVRREDLAHCRVHERSPALQRLCAPIRSPRRQATHHAAGPEIVDRTVVVALG